MVCVRVCIVFNFDMNLIDHPAHLCKLDFAYCSIYPKIFKHKSGGLIIYIPEIYIDKSGGLVPPYSLLDTHVRYLAYFPFYELYV